MSDLPLNGMMQQMNAHPHSGEHLEVLGKRAAAGWGAGEHKTMTEAVTATVKQAQLSPEQVRRVVEFANTAAYLTEFKKEGSPHHVVDFPGGPADASAILQDLNDGGGGSVYDRGTGEYDTPPGEQKTASAGAEDALEALFGKMAEAAPPLPFENPHGEVIDLKDKLAGASEHLRSQISGLEVMYAELGDRMYNQVKQAALGGTTLGEVMQAWETVAPSEDHVKVAFTLITPRLLREGVFHDVAAMVTSVDKTAGARMVNPAHPLVTEFSEFCDSLSKLAELREARREVHVHLEHLNSYIKQASLVGKAFDVAGRAGAAARPLADKVVGRTGGAVVQHGIHLSPAVVAAVAAHNLHEYGDNSPGLAGQAYRGLEKMTPGTDRHKQHVEEMQYGR